MNSATAWDTLAERAGELLTRPAARAPALPAAPAGPLALPSAGASFSGRPTYTPFVFGGPGGMRVILPRDQSFALLAELYRNIPVMKESVSIYSGFIGTPCLKGESDPETARLEAWRDSVGVGAPGAGTTGLTSFLDDHLGQCLLYGFGVGECGIPVQRNGVERLMSYASPAFFFESDPVGNVAIVQWQNLGTRVALNMETAFVSTLDTLASNPEGQPLFYSVPSVGQTWLEALFCHRANWQRTGHVRYHVNWKTPAGFNDPKGKLAEEVRAANEDAWNAVMKASVVKGEVLDFFSTGDITVATIGADGIIMDFEMSKRQLMEEVVVASGIPPFLFGYQWATTERMSYVQAQKFSERIRSMRRMLEPAIRKITDLHLRLSGRRVPYSIEWGDILLNDLLETANADLADAKAEWQRIQNARGMWVLGFYTQQQAGEALGVEKPAVAYAEPPALTLTSASGGGGGFGAAEADDEELRLKALSGHNGNGRGLRDAA